MAINESQKAWRRDVSQSEWDSIFNPSKPLTAKELPRDGHPPTPSPLPRPIRCGLPVLFHAPALYKKLRLALHRTF